MRYLKVMMVFLVGAVSSVCGAWDITSCSWVGGPGDSDEVMGVRILSDGKIAIAANASGATIGSVTPSLVNGATASAGGVVALLSNDGKTVLAAVRCAGESASADS